MPSSNIPPLQALSMEQTQDTVFEKIEFFEKIQDEIFDGMEKSTYADVKFITPHTLSNIWTRERLERLCEMIDPHGIPVERTMHDLKEQLLRTISILVQIHWRQWDKFGKIFFDRRYSNNVLRVDKNIKEFTQDQLAAEDFLANKRIANEFLQVRDTFFPFLIKTGMVKIYRKGRIPPFVQQEGVLVELGSGGFGTVTKECIAEHRFQGDVKQKTTYGSLHNVARKEFQHPADFQKEVDNLVSLRKASSTHDRIAPFLAIISIGDRLNILSDIALLDLEEFLEGRHTEFDVSQDRLMGELASIADALRWLHDGIWIPRDGNSKSDQRKKTGFVFCCHMDIKPENILIYPGGAVGEWKISDFGISRIKDSPRRTTTMYQSGKVSTSEHLAVPDLLLGDLTRKLTSYNHTGAQRPPGTWTAPEVYGGSKRVGRESDIWSFGCVFVLVCALALGPLELQELQSQRGKTAEGYDYDAARGDCFYESNGKDVILNFHIDSWLKSLPGRRDHHADFLSNCYNLVHSTLAIDPKKRLSALQLHQALDTIFDPPMDACPAACDLPPPSSRDSSNFIKATSRLTQDGMSETNQYTLPSVVPAIVEPTGVTDCGLDPGANVDSPACRKSNGVPAIQQAFDPFPEHPDINDHLMAKRNKGKELWTSNGHNTDALDDISPPLSATEVKDAQDVGGFSMDPLHDLHAPGPSDMNMSSGREQRTSPMIFNDNPSFEMSRPSRGSNLIPVTHESQPRLQPLVSNPLAEENLALRSSSTLPNGNTSSRVFQSNNAERRLPGEITTKTPRRQTVPGPIRSARPAQLNEMKTSPASLSSPRKPVTVFESPSRNDVHRISRAHSFMSNQASLNSSGILSINNSSSRQSIPPQALIPIAMPICRLESGQPFQSIIPSNGEIVAFVSSQCIYVYPLHGERDIHDQRLLKAPAGCDWASVSLSGPYMLARAQVRSTKLKRFKVYHIQSKSPSCFEIKEIGKTYDVACEEGVISSNGYMMFQRQTEVHLRHIDASKQIPEEPLPTGAIIYKTWFNDNGSWAFAWCVKKGDHLVMAWKVENPAICQEFVHHIPDHERRDTPVQSILSFPDSRMLLLWKARGNITIVPEPEESRPQPLPQELHPLTDLEAITISPTQNCLVYIRSKWKRKGFFSLPVVHTTLYIRRIDFDSDGSCIFGELRKGRLEHRFQRGSCLSVAQSADEHRMYVFISHSNGHVEKVIYDEHEL